ncbi:2OG-Fe(II) oxygenase [soil metagenome]
MKEKIAAQDWQKVADEMNDKGYCILPQLLSAQDCHQFISSYSNAEFYRKTITMERYRFGLGEYKYFKYPLPYLIQTIRTNVYPHLAPIANNWMKALNINTQFPVVHKQMLEHCHENNQSKPTVLTLKYGIGGHNTMHQDLYGDIFFPMQAVIFLNEPGKDFTGGEFVLTQQTPRAQSKAMVLQPKQGDMLLFTTNFKPVKGSKGYYRVNIRHGVSEVHSGERHTLGIIFHDALN